MTFLSTSYESNNPVKTHTVKYKKNSHNLSKLVEDALEQYFDQLDGTPPSNLYQLVISQVEQPLLQSVMQLSGGNQTKASEILGISRATLRKKLALYGIE